LGKSERNEKRKLTATLLNGIALTLMAASVSLILNGIAMVELPRLAALFALAIALHLLGRLALRRIEE
jgi:hypothetical protein